MGEDRSVVINGDLGSGKTTVSVLLAERLGIRRISIGDLYRELARQQHMTALQYNLHAELDDKIDFYVDQLQRDIAASGERLVVDSRLAWFFFTDAMKVHIVCDPAVAAHRAMGRQGDPVERYESQEEAEERLADRGESERRRFIARYGADKTQLRNYDLVCDSTSATPDEIVDVIISIAYMRPGGVALAVDPRRVRVTGGATHDEGPLRLDYRPPHFLAVSGAKRLTAAVRDNVGLVEATLSI